MWDCVYETEAGRGREQVQWREDSIKKQKPPLLLKANKRCF